MKLAFSIMMILVASWGSPVCASCTWEWVCTESQPLLAGGINLDETDEILIYPRNRG